jgi:hypothetical protein
VEFSVPVITADGNQRLGGAKSPRKTYSRLTGHNAPFLGCLERGSIYKSKQGCGRSSFLRPYRYAPITMLIPDLVSQNAKRNPSGPFYIYAHPDSSAIVTITHLEFQRATHRAASLLRRDGEDLDGQVVAIIAQSDTVLYHATLVGIMTANCVVRVCNL